MRPRPHVFAALLLLAAAPVVASAQRRDDEMERPEVRDVRLRGVKAVEEDELLASIATDESGCRSLLVSFICAFYKGDAVYQREYLDREEFRKDVLRAKVFYWRRGFREAQVDTAVSRPDKDDRVRVTFSIVEGRPTLVERVEVQRPPAELSDRAMRRLVLVRAARPFNTLQLDSTLLRLRQAMWTRGFADAEVTQETVVDTATRSARVAITVTPGPRSVVGDIHVHGNRRISERAIRNSLLFDENEVFRLDDLLRSQRALYESGLFRRAALFVRQAQVQAPCATFDGSTEDDQAADTVVADSVKRVDVCVEEADLREARASAGFNTVEFFQVEGRFSHLNFLGGARRLDITAAVGNLGADQLNGRGIFRQVTVADDERSRFLAPTYQASVELRQRWFQSARNTLGLSVFGNRRSAPSIFVDRGYGSALTLTREVAPRATASGSYRFEITRVDAGDVYFCVNYGVCDRGTIGALRGQQRLSPFTVNGRVDRSNDPFEPTTGYRAQLDLDHASAFTMSDYRYNRAYLDASVYRRMGRRGTLATRLRTGWVAALASTAAATGTRGAADGDILHPRRRFYSGGSQSVRGFGENQLGPRVLTIPALVLRGPNGERCPPTIDIRDCNPNGFVLDGDSLGYSDNDFTPRPLGGNALVEGSVELRVPIFPTFADGNLIGAVFVDAGWLRGRTLTGDSRADGALTPGLGVRYRSPVGPIRVDVGINPFLRETLPVVTEEITNNPDGTQTRRLVRLRTAREYIPGRDAGAIEKVLQRLTLHLSIGEAF